MKHDIWLEDLGAIPVFGEDRWNAVHASANADAFKKAFALLLNGGKISVGPGIFFLNESINIPTNIWIEGAGTCNPDDANIRGIGGTIFRPTADAIMDDLFYSSVLTHSIKLSNFSIIGGRKQENGIIHDIDLKTGVRLVGINHAIDSVLVAYISGDGIHLGDPSIDSYPYDWIFQATNNRVTGCGGYGIRVDTTDGFVTNNLFTGNVKGNISYGGGNIWQGNHFDNTRDVDHAALTVSDHLGEQILGNYFDKSAVALRLIGNGSSSYNGTISGNKFRANALLDIHAIGIKNLVIDQFYSSKGGYPGRQTSYSVRFDDCIRPIIRNATWANCWRRLDVNDPEGQQDINYLNCIHAGEQLEGSDRRYQRISAAGIVERN